MWGVYLQLLGRLLTVLGAVNYLFMANGMNAFTQLGRYPNVVRGLMVAIGLSGLWFMFDKTYYLPFLGETVIPVKGTNAQEVKGETKTFTIKNLPPNVPVLYWAAGNEKKSYLTPIEAYSNYSNSGVTFSDASGNVSVNMPCPSEYNVKPFGIVNKTLKPHLHYRYGLPGKGGMFSRVFTEYLKDC